MSRFSFKLLIAETTMWVWTGMLLVCPHAQAEQDVWTLSRAEQVALSNSPRMRSARAARDVAHAYRTFGTMPKVENPVLNVRAMIGKPDDPAATYSTMLGLPFDVSGKRRAYKAEARQAMAEAEARLRATRNDVLARVRETYARVCFADALRRVTEEMVSTARELLSSVEQRFAAGAVTALDRSLAATQYAENLAALEQTRRSLIRAEVDFRRALDLRPDASAKLTPLGLPEIPAWLTKEEAVARALKHRQETVAWASARDRLKAAERRQRREAIAPVLAGFEVERQGNYNAANTVGFNVATELPLILKNQGERAVTRSQAQAAELERELTEHEIAREVVAAYDLLGVALAEVSTLEEHAMPEVERTLGMVKSLLESGAVDYFRLLTARSNAFSLRRQRIDALREAWLLRFELQRATGEWESGK